MAKMVRAKRGGFWDGHRRRAGAVFPVADDAKESWFETVGPADPDVTLPAQLQTAQAPPPRGFVQVMDELAKTRAGNAKSAQLQPQTLGEAARSVLVDDGVSDLT